MGLFRRAPKDNFRLDTDRVIWIDGKQYVIETFHVVSTPGNAVQRYPDELTVRFVSLRHWLELRKM